MDENMKKVQLVQSSAKLKIKKTVLPNGVKKKQRLGLNVLNFSINFCIREFRIVKKYSKNVSVTDDWFSKFSSLVFFESQRNL